MRARYFRGHGVHSPFVYAMVRHVFMRRDLLPGDRGLYHALIAAGVPLRRSVELQNLYIYCGYASFGLNRADTAFCILTRDLLPADAKEIVRRASEQGSTVAVLAPYDGRARQAMCREIVGTHPSTTVDNRGYLLIFNNHLPKQHFRI